ncbi:ankyrin repeat domain-containing protein 17-like [Haliotis rufescens]|uniref:ankyrin repeat domain-containing protein 17-like n=1 Tax=Haliotis rufescens TaxID=6454 RepID=UPI00201F1667|nr:ankyrin repeat domain-containing protein 17-like [Haliotis rufescens]
MGQCCSKEVVHIERLNVAGRVQGGVGQTYTAEHITGGIANEGSAERPHNDTITVGIGLNDNHTGNIGSVPRDSSGKGYTNGIPRASSDMGKESGIQRATGAMGNTNSISRATGDMGNTSGIPRATGDMGKESGIPRASSDMGKESGIPRATGDMGNTSGISRSTGGIGNTSGIPRAMGDIGNTSGIPRATGDMGKESGIPRASSDMGKESGIPRASSDMGKESGIPRATGDMQKESGISRSTGGIGNTSSIPRAMGDMGNTSGTSRATGDIGNTNSIPRAMGDIGNTSGIPRATGDIGNTNGIPRATGDMGNTNGIPRATGDMGKESGISRASSDMENTSGISRATGDTGNTNGIPRATGDMGKESGIPRATGDTGNTSTTTHASGELGHPVSARDIRPPDTPGDSWTRNSTVQDPAVGGGVSFQDIDELNLYVAYAVGGEKKVQCLPLQELVDINRRDDIGKTPLIVAAWKGRRGVFGLLVSRGADASVQDANSNNILHWASHGGNVDMVQYVISSGLVDINSRGSQGYSPVMMAAERGHKEVVALLAQKGCDMSHVTNGGNNILHVTCTGGDVTMVKCLLLMNIVDINSRGANERTATMMAVLKGHSAVFELLVSEGSDLSPVSSNNNNILHEACVGGDVSIVNYIISKGVVAINSRGKYDRTPVMVAAEFGHTNVLELLVREGGDVNVRSSEGNTILHAACLGGHVKMVRHVLSTTRVNVNARGKKGRSPLMLAAWMGHQEVFELLVSAGSDVSLVDDGGNNILHVACRGGHADMVAYLLSKDVADMEAMDNQGLTAVRIAEEKKNKAVVGVLSSKFKSPSH